VSDPNYLVRVLKGRDYKDEPKVPAPKDEPKALLPEKPEAPAPAPAQVTVPVPEPGAVEMPPEDDAPYTPAEQAEAKKTEAEHQRTEAEARAKEREAKRLAREERERARETRRQRNAAIRAKRLAKLEGLLPRPISFVSVSSAIQSRVNAFELAARSGRKADALRLADAYEQAGFSLMDLPAAMNDHFEDEARDWAGGDTVEAWAACERADWLVWVCTGEAGWGYPGLWLAASDCARQAIAVASPKIPRDVAKFLADAVRDVERFVATWRRDQPDLDLLDDLRRSLKKLVENVEHRLERQPDLSLVLKAALAVASLVELKGRPAVDAVVRSAAVLADVMPERSAIPGSWMPEDPERGEKWVSEGRPRAEIKAKLAFLAPLVRKRIPVPVGRS
jgi:hypothetical protein